MNNDFARIYITAISKARNQESQRQTEPPIVRMAKKPYRIILLVEESKSSSDGEIYSMYSVSDSGRSN